MIILNMPWWKLREETGYIGEIKEVSPILRSNAGIMRDSGMAVYVEVDENRPENQKSRATIRNFGNH